MSRSCFWACLLGLCLGLTRQTAQAVILFGNGDPAYNTSAPAGTLANSGWQYEGQWGAFLGTAIAPHFFLAAQHIGGSAGMTFTFQGHNYTTTAYWDDPASDLRLWKVSGTFSTYAPLYGSPDELGKQMVVIGRGTQRGAPVMASQATTNILAGWQDGPADGAMRWGLNRVSTAANWLLMAQFTGTQGANEGFLSPGDSSGAIFIQDYYGTWKLAGINYGIDGPFATNTNGAQFYGAIFNEDGLFVSGAQIPMPQDGIVRPAHFYASRVSAELSWIQNITGVIPPPAPLPQLTLQAAGGNLTVGYPTNATGYQLESSPALGNNASWQSVTNSPALSGTNWTFTFPAVQASAFFRLQFQN